MRRFPLIALALVSSCAKPAATPTTLAASSTRSTSSNDPPPDYLAVHIDTVARESFDQFVDARHEWLAQLRKVGVTDGRGVFLQVGDGAFYSVRRFTRFGDFDTRGDAIEKSLEALPKEARERYDRLADTSLVFPHTSQVWSSVADLGYAPATGAGDERSACCGSLIVEDVRADPASSKAYSDATTAMNAALAEARYPLTRTTYHTVFGAGHVFTLWLAPSKETLDAAGSVEDAVARVQGAGRAAELKAAIDAVVAHRDTAALVVRHDMTQ
jgi:hypothetical protein